MKKRKGSPYGDFIGRIGNVVCYDLNGQIVARRIGKVTQWSDQQKAVQMRTALLSPIIAATEKYLTIGYKTTPRLQTWSIKNKAISENNPTAIKGTYPEMEVDYAKLLLSMGNLPAPKNAQVTVTGNVLNFSWEADLENKKGDETDQIMVMAYFPETYKTITLIGGAQRTAEQQSLNLTTWKERTVIETYLSFISEDRDSVSNSLYTGQIIWNNNLADHGKA